MNKIYRIPSPQGSTVTNTNRFYPVNRPSRIGPQILERGGTIASSRLTPTKRIRKANADQIAAFGHEIVERMRREFGQGAAAT